MQQAHLSHNELSPPKLLQPTIGSETDGSIRSNEQVLDPWDCRYNWKEFVTSAHWTQMDPWIFGPVGPF